MGKKVKKNTRNIQKERTTPKQVKPPVEVVGDGVIVVKERKPCVHIDKGIDLSKVSAKIGSDVPAKCEDCREGAIDRRETKGKGKQGKKKGAGVSSRQESKVWVCLECGHFACGGVGFPTTAQSHALRHTRQTRHPCVVQLENSHLCWCFPCNSLIPVGKLEQDGEQKDVLLEAMKLIKGRSPERVSADVEDVWFGSGSILGEMKSEASNSIALDGTGAYVVRGLSNLGNTCFFNSVMQNLFAMDQLRDFFVKLDRSAGPLTMALKKLFTETSLEEDSRNGINPKGLFGSICAKAPQFRGYQQQDSHELLRCLLDGLCTEELNARKLLKDEVASNTDPTFVDAIFAGQLSSTVSCMECNHSSVVYEPFLDLSLPLPTKKSPPKKASLLSRSKRTTKLPLKKEVKKGGKIRGKGKTGTSPVSSERFTCQPESKGSSCLAPFASPLKEETMASSDDMGWMDFIGPNTTPNGLELDSQNNDCSTIQDSESKDAPQNDDTLQNSSEEQSQVCTQNVAQKSNLNVSEGNSFENDLPFQVQGSEVLLLPYKEENLTTEEMVSKESEVSSVVMGHEQETLDFDGFGDLFNEPEVVSVPNSNCQGKDVAETGFLPANSSESDPDEVDETDGPLSIDSCLSYFTKAELLKEQAWHCENCSKILQAQKVEARDNQQKNIPRNRVNVSQIKSQTDPLAIGVGSVSLDNDNLECDSVSTAAAESLITCTKKLISSNQNHLNGEISSLDKENTLSDTSCQTSFTEVSQRENCLNSVYTPQGDCESSSQLSIGDQTSKSCNMKEADSIGSYVDRVPFMDYQLTPRIHKSDDSEEVKPKCSKVMRDATKRILINKTPEILTIHLKRFSQDARGRLSKLSGHVNFRYTIDLSPYMDPRSNEKNNYKYCLIGVVEHSGTMRGGHYVAYVRGNTNKEKTDTDGAGFTWFYASDAYVREAPIAEVLRSEAYILFYERM